MFKAFPLERTAEPFHVIRNDVYVICKDMSIQSRTDPTIPINWELVELANSWMYRTKNEMKPIAISFYGWATDIPEGHMTPPSTPRVAPECPDAPLKAIYEFDEKLGHCAQIINDQVQTETMAKFVRGGMSYAEMRGLCG
jgi:hypothetical protein